MRVHVAFETACWVGLRAGPGAVLAATSSSTIRGSLEISRLTSGMAWPVQTPKNQDRKVEGLPGGTCPGRPVNELAGTLLAVAFANS